MVSTVDGSWARWLFGPPGWKNVLRELVVYTASLFFAVRAFPEPSAVVLVASIAVAVACLLARRRFPAIALVASGLVVSAFCAVLSFSAGRRLGMPVKLGAAVLGCTAVAVLRTVAEVPQEADVLLALVGSGYLLIYITVPAVLGFAVARRGALVEALRERAVHLERERRSLVSEARTRERARIAMDMHDSLGHQLTLISLQAGGLKVTATEPAQARTAAELHEAARRAMVELREIVGVLGRETGQETPPPGSPLERLPDLLDSARATGTAVGYTETGTKVELPRATESAIHRIVQEGLTNAARHAPGAPVMVRLNYESDGVIVEVLNGNAVSPPQRGFGGGRGLSGLRERARLAGGVLHAAPVPGGGFRLAGVLPYDATPAPEPDDALDGFVPSNPLVLNETEALMRRMRNRPVLFGSVIAGVVLIGVALLGFAVYVGVTRQETTIGSLEYVLSLVGAEEQEIVAVLPPPDADTQRQLAAETGAPPENARCVYYYASSSKEPKGSTTAYRFCFRDGLLLEKQKFVVRDPFPF
ncbi:sensor histidine kinase [Allokutzneria sp. NRRL B-24872]|uniref:sensor histidine kinase n=1 Tax=Allokutzneria sp. NRRL B-24872 TaxID=1137961 RepID=UPI000A38D2EA|nr:histidine kinase [Allokutzneria sp. NRRL B-24872]